MKVKAFLDTNILLDLIQNGRPCTPYSREIMQSVYDGDMEAVITTQSILDASYTAQKAGQIQAFLDIVKLWCSHANIESVNAFDIRFAVKDYMGDFEDDAQYYQALESCCDVIITSDENFRKKYNGKNELLRLMSPQEFVSNYKPAPKLS